MIKCAVLAGHSHMDLGGRIREEKWIHVSTKEAPQGAHTICLCSRLLFYSKCTRFTVCFSYSDISLTMYINQ